MRASRDVIAAWLGPTKLATAILFATITNIVAYLPLLLVSGESGRFLYSLPVVLACALVVSRIVSMTFIPMLGYYLLRPYSKATPTRRGTADAGLRRVLLSGGGMGRRSPLARARGVARAARGRRRTPRAG